MHAPDFRNHGLAFAIFGEAGIISPDMVSQRFGDHPDPELDPRFNDPEAMASPRLSDEPAPENLQLESPYV